MSIERHRNSRKSTEMRQNKHTEIYPKSHILQNSADFTETCIFSRKTNNITERVAVVKSWITNTSYSLPVEFGTAKHWNIQSTEAAVVSLHRSVAAPPRSLSLWLVAASYDASRSLLRVPFAAFYGTASRPLDSIVRQLLMHTHTHTRGESAVTRCIGLLVCRPAEAAAAAAAAELSSLIIRIPDPWHRRCHSGNVLFISKWYIETIK